MEVSRNSFMETRKWTGLGRCRHFFWLGVVFDTVGAAVLFTGVFTDLLFYDLLLYLGSIIIFFSLLWWVFWYTGNIELIPDKALQRLYHVPSSSVVNSLNQSPSLTFTIRTFSATLGQLRPGQHHRMLLRRSPHFLNMTTLTGQVEKQLAKEDQDKGGMRNVRESGDAEGFSREDLSPEPKEAKSAGVCAPGPDAGPLGPEAGQPVTHLMHPEFTPSLLDRSLPPIILASTSLPAVPLPFKGQPVDTLASEIQTAAAPMVSRSLPLVSVDLQNNSLSTLASQIHPLVAAQSQFQVPIVSESDFQNLSSASQTQPPAVQAAQAQALATQVFPIQLLPAPLFQNQSSDQQVTLAVQDTLHDTQQAPKSSVLVQEIALSQSSHAQEPPAGQELSQEVPDAVPQLPTSLALATEAQQSMPHESAPCPTAENGHLP